MPARLTGRVAVTPRSLSGGHPSLDRLVDAGLELVFPSPGRTPSAEDLLASVPGCVGYLAGVERVTGELVAASPGLRVIARNGVGVDNVDLAAAATAGIEVRPAVGANARGVAELAVGLLFATARHLAWSDHRMKAEAWDRRQGFELAGRTLGVVGLGHIGRTVVEMSAGLGLEVVGYDPYPSPSWRPPACFRWATLDEVVASADLLTLHLPPSDRALVDTDLLARLGTGAVLVNTSRSELVDDDAVLSALEDGRLAAYAVDAFATEPPADWTLVRHERVIATPHVGGFTAESVHRASESAVDAILQVLAADEDLPALSRHSVQG
jgi:D-3-phosphoglycerate dehydrogenase